MAELPVPRRRTDVDAVTATSSYRELIERLQRRIRESQARAARALNSELVMLYWSIGHDILAEQQAGGWGEDIVGRIAEDLRLATGSARGFSRRNLFYMRRFATLWPDPEKVQPLAAQIGWSHHQVLLDAFGHHPDLYAWYAAKASANRWPRRYLQGQIKLGLHERQGAAVTNFDLALEPADADQALTATKDPYVFDFLELAEDAHERDLERALIADIQKFLLELGTGFAFYGRQKPLLVGEHEFFLDLLFYHHALRRFVVIELKIGKFEPEFVSKMNFTSTPSTNSCASAMTARASGSSSAQTATRPSPSSHCTACTRQSPSRPGGPIRPGRSSPPLRSPKTFPPISASSLSSTRSAPG